MLPQTTVALRVSWESILRWPTWNGRNPSSSSSSFFSNQPNTLTREVTQLKRPSIVRKILKDGSFVFSWKLYVERLSLSYVSLVPRQALKYRLSKKQLLKAWPRFLASSAYSLGVFCDLLEGSGNQARAMCLLLPILPCYSNWACCRPRNNDFVLCVGETNNTAIFMHIKKNRNESP